MPKFSSASCVTLRSTDPSEYSRDTVAILPKVVLWSSVATFDAGGSVPNRCFPENVEEPPVTCCPPPSRSEQNLSSPTIGASMPLHTLYISAPLGRFFSVAEKLIPPSGRLKLDCEADAMSTGFPEISLSIDQLF
jgi:hypothetical protein